jgi:hypothetical protein
MITELGLGPEWAGRAIEKKAFFVRGAASVRKFIVSSCELIVLLETKITVPWNVILEKNRQ